MGLIRGFAAPFRAAAFVSRERLWHLVLLPVLVNAALATGAGWASARFMRQEMASWALKSPALSWLLLAVTTVLGAIVIFIVLQPLVGAVLNDRLCERVERRIRGEAPKAPFLASSGRALAHGLLKLMLYGLALVVGLILSATTGPGGAFGVVLGALFLAYDGFDYPLARRSAGFAAKWRYLALHPGQTIGYGVGATLLYLVPLALVVAPPLTAVGATLAFLDSEDRREARKDARKNSQLLKNKGSAA